MYVASKIFTLFLCSFVFSCGYLDEHLKNLGGISQSPSVPPPSVTPPSAIPIEKIFSQFGAGSGKSFQFLDQISNSKGEVYFTAFTTSTLAFGDQIGAQGTQDAIVGKISRSGTIEWLKRYGVAGGTCAQTSSAKIIFDNASNIFFSFVCSINPGFDELTPAGAGTYPQVISKLKTDGTILWTKQVSTDHSLNYTSVKDSPNEPNKIFISGRSYRDLGGSKIGTCTSPNQGLYVAKIDGTLGTLDWISQHCMAGSPSGPTLNFDSGGNPFLGSGINGTFSPATHIYGAAEGSSMGALSRFSANTGTIDFIIKHSVDNAGIALQYFGGVSFDRAANSYMFARINGNSTNGGTLTGTSTSGTRAVFNVHDNTGARLWGREFAAGGVTFTEISWIENVSGTGGGDFIVGGYSTGIITCGTCTTIGSSGSPNMFVTRLSNTGAVTWLRNIRGVRAEQMKVDSSESVFIYGKTSAPPFPGAQQFGTSGIEDLLVAKLDSSGSVTWAKEFGGGPGKVFEAASGTFSLIGGGAMIFSGRTDGTTAPTFSQLGRPSPNQRIIGKLDSSGSLLWGTQIGTDSDGFYPKLYELSDGTYLLTNKATSLVANDQVGSLGTQDIHISRFSSAGALLLDYQVGGGAGVYLSTPSTPVFVDNMLYFSSWITGAYPGKNFFAGSAGTTGTLVIRHNALANPD